MATAKSTTAPARPPSPEEDPNSPFEGLYHLLRRCVHGHDTDIDSICHYQDVFGHSCEEDHEKAAEGEYKETFYRLYEEAYGVIATIQFDRKHSAYWRNVREQIDDLECRVEELKDENERLRNERQNRDNDICEAGATINELRYEKAILENEKRELTEAIAKCGTEIIRLKAKLFDMMEAQK